MGLRPQGLEYLTARLVSLLDPTQPPPMPRAAQEPLRELMADHLETVLQQTAADLRTRIFLVTRQQVQALRDMGTPETALELVQDLNATGMDPLNFQINTRLHLIMSVPTDDGWEAWWTRTALDSGGIRLPDGPQEPEPAVTAELSQAVRAIARTAAPHMPGCRYIARGILQGTVRTHIGWDYCKPRKSAIRLGPVIVVRRMVETLSNRLLLPQEEVPAPDDRTPEEILQELLGAGMKVEQDVGSINSLEELRDAIGANRLDLVDISPQGRVWSRRGIPYGTLVSSRDVPGSRFNDKLDPEHPRAGGIGPAEEKLITLAAPAHPGRNPRDNWTRNRNARALGFALRIPPDQVINYMTGESDDPQARHLGTCPMARDCPTQCGRMQREGEFPFPVNQDGRYNSCRYYRFLRDHQDASGVERENLAALNIQLAGRELAKHARDGDVRIVPTREPPERERWDEVPAPAHQAQATLF